MSRLLALLLYLAPGQAEVLRLDDWSGLRPDPAVTRDGQLGLAWTGLAEQTMTTARGAPADWSSYQTLRFWLHVAEPTDSRLTLIVSSENPASDGGDYYSLTIDTNYRGWRRFQLPLSALAAVRQPLGWQRIDKLFFSANWAHKLDPATVVHLAGFTLDTAPLPGCDRPPGELLGNRSFELDGNHDGQPDGWSASGYNTAARAGQDPQGGRNGGAALRIDGQAGARAGASMNFAGEVVRPDHLYRLSAWVRIEGTSTASEGTSARLTSVGADGAVLKSDYRVCRPGPRDWTRYEWLVALPEATRRFNLVLFHHGQGTAWWDDVSLWLARPVEALSPARDALVADGRPTFRWRASAREGTLTISPDPGFAAETSRSYAVSGESFTPPEALPTGQTYYWQAALTDAGGEGCLVSSNDGQTPRFYAGTWRQRTEAVRAKLAPWRTLLTDLRALGERTGMWDPFTGPVERLRRADALLDGTPAEPAAAIAELDQVVAELELVGPWWRRIFADDEGLLADLDLDRPGLEQVKAAAARRDWPTARRELRGYFRQRRAPSYYARHEQPPTRSPNITTDARAEQYLTHQMPIHSYQTPTYDLGRDFDWHILPTVDIEWPTALHRHFHWERLAEAYGRTGNEAYAKEIALQLLDWAADNPLERWDSQRRRFAWSTLNAAVRLYSSWLNSWLMIRDSASFDADAQFVFLTGLREHGRFLMANRTPVGRGNWAVAEARGLAELGVMLPEFKESAAWRDEAYRRLREELEAQVLADGVHVERSPGYHSMTLSCFLEPVRLALLNRSEVADLERFTATLEKMHELYLYGVKPNHKMAQLGDAGPMSADSLLQRGWDMFRREDMQWVVTGGKQGRPPVHRSYAFPAAGQYVSRSAWNDPAALWSLVDWGGFLGHCHEDMGQLCCHAYGGDLLIDSGRYSYSWPMRAPFYQTIGHNTVLVDQTTQKRRDPLTARWVTTDQFDLFRGTHDNSEPTIHERTVVFRQPNEAGPGYWLVVDRLTGEGRHRLDQRWHATEHLTGRADDGAVLLSTRAGAAPQPSLRLANLAQPGLQTAVVEGAVSYQWYVKIPVDVAQFTLEGELPAVFATVLYPTPPGAEPAAVTVARLPVAGEATAVRVTIADRGRQFDDTWLVRHGAPATLTAGELVTDAGVALVREEGGRRSWLLGDGSRLTWRGQELFAAAAPVDGAGALLGERTVAVATAGRGLRFAAPAALTVNGRPASGTLDQEAEPVPAPPRQPGGPRIEVPQALPPIAASSRAEMLPTDRRPPAEAVLVEAESFTAQGGGSVERTAAKVGAQGESFLHWDLAGHWLEWRAEVPAGRYELWLRACGAEPRAVRKLLVDGRVTAAGEALEVLGTGGYSNERDDWRSFRVTASDGRPLALTLGAGAVTLRIENVDGHSLNLDWLALVPAG